MPRSPMIQALVLGALCLAGRPALAVDEPVAITLPAQIELTRLADMAAEIAGVSLQYNPQKIQGIVRLSVKGPVSPHDLWNILNQVLVPHGFTTVVAQLPALYQIVQLSEAAGLGAALDPAVQDALAFQPGYSVVIHDLEHISAEAVIKALGPLLVAQYSQVRAFGSEPRRVVLSGVTGKIAEARVLLKAIDRPGLLPVIRLFPPQRTSTQALQASTLTTWTAVNRITSQTREAEVQVSPDGRHLILLTSAQHIDELEAVAASLDRSEPVITRTYQPRFFGIADVAKLLRQVFGVDPAAGGAAGAAGPQPGLSIVEDTLTNSLIVKATELEHQRIAELVAKLDDVPEGTRRKARTFVIKNRDVDDLAMALTGMIEAGVAQSGDEAQAGAPRQPQIRPGGQAGVHGATPPPAPPAPLSMSANGQAGGAMPGQPPVRKPGVIVTDDLILTTDPATSRIIAIGEPLKLDLITALIADLDQRQPQVELEVILTTLTEGQSLDLGIELIGQFQRGEVSTTLSSLFGLSTPVGGNPLVRSIGNAEGFGGVVLKPGDFGAVVRALETVNNGKSIIRSKVVVTNNANAMVNGVLQQPVASLNAGETVTTTSFGGTTDAGTQLSITPQISAADHVTLTYQITQSAFVGSATANLPPPKRSDNLSSVATIPDGFVIALGGLSSVTDIDSESRLPLLGRIPGLGNLFKSQTRSGGNSRFLVFIRANILRRSDFGDLRYASDRQAESAKLPSDVPVLKPQLIR